MIPRRIMSQKHIHAVFPKLNNSQTVSYSFLTDLPHFSEKTLEKFYPNPKTLTYQEALGNVVPKSVLNDTRGH